jgi:hypothetical protein
MMAIQVIKDHCLSNYYLIQRDKLNGKGAISVKVVMTGVFKVRVFCDYHSHVYVLLLKHIVFAPKSLCDVNYLKDLGC